MHQIQYLEKRNSESAISSESNSVYLDADNSTSEPILNHNARTHKIYKSSHPLVSQSNRHRRSGFVESSGASSPASMHNSGATHNPEEPAMWECAVCTFLNRVSVMNYDASIFKHMLSLFLHLDTSKTFIVKY